MTVDEKLHVSHIKLEAPFRPPKDGTLEPSANTKTRPGDSHLLVTHPRQTGNRNRARKADRVNYGEILHIGHHLLPKEAATKPPGVSIISGVSR